MSNVLQFSHHHLKHVESTPLGPFNRPCAPSPTLDQNVKMANDEGDCSGKI